MPNHTPTELNNWDEPGFDELPEYDPREFWPLLAVCLAITAIAIIGASFAQSIMEGLPA